MLEKLFSYIFHNSYTFPTPHGDLFSFLFFFSTFFIHLFFKSTIEFVGFTFRPLCIFTDPVVNLKEKKKMYNRGKKIISQLLVT
jgi:hypothetical protein